MVQSAAFSSLALIVVVAALLGLLSRKLKQPTVIAYIATGLLLGSAGLGLVSTTPSTELLSELGLAFLLFLIGLEIRIEDVKEILRPTVAIAVSQMALVGLAGYITAQALGFPFLESVIVAAAVMFSSTAVVVKLLADKDEVTTLPGKIDVGILLVEDLAVVLILAVMETGASTPLRLGISLLKVAFMVAAIGSLSYLSSRYLLPRVFQKISENRHAFFIHGVAWLFVMVTVASQLGISAEIGAFFAGLALAQIPYSQELQERVRPLTNFFMAVFFIQVGLQLSPGMLESYWVEAVIASTVLMSVKFTVMFALVDRARFTPETSFKAAINKAQTSEFSLILGSLAVAQGLASPGLLGFLSMVAITTMGVSSYFISYNSRIYTAFEHMLEKLESEEKEDIEVRELSGHLVVVGYDELARRALEELEEYFDDVVVVDRNPLNTRELSESRYEYIYGDFRHPRIRNAAGLGDAAMVVCFAPDNLVNRNTVEEAPRDATIVVKSDGIEEAAELYEQGAHYVTVKNLLSSEKLGEYLKLYLEDRELFLEEVNEELESMRWGGKDE
ncbi:MAG: cation:proton antiporter [Candidatus Nanohaloarchaea archaeon]